MVGLKLRSVTVDHMPLSSLQFLSSQAITLIHLELRQMEPILPAAMFMLLRKLVPSLERLTVINAVELSEAERAALQPPSLLMPALTRLSYIFSRM
jgi:hypothetical protein